MNSEIKIHTGNNELASLKCILRVAKLLIYIEYHIKSHMSEPLKSITISLQYSVFIEKHQTSAQIPVETQSKQKEYS